MRLKFSYGGSLSAPPPLVGAGYHGIALRLTREPPALLALATNSLWRVKVKPYLVNGDIYLLWPNSCSVNLDTFFQTLLKVSIFI